MLAPFFFPGTGTLKLLARSVPGFTGSTSMSNQDFQNPLPTALEAERLIAACRQKIIELEAHGLPDKQGAPWDVLDDILADIRRHRPGGKAPD